jgi:ATP-dependent Lhr-like helicase
MTVATSTAAPADALARFHPLIREWFARRFGTPTDAQAHGWPHVQAGRDILIAAPTGSGKTFAAFLSAIDRLVRDAEAGTLREVTQVVYVSPLKALGNDIQRNLDEPLAELAALAKERGIAFPVLRTGVRTGDTPSSQRQAMVRRPPHILITTPESLYLMLTAERARQTLREVRTVIVDEIHALARDKRGSHLALSLERLDHVVTAAGEAKPSRIGLSATQRPIEEVARYLVGVEAGVVRPCTVVDMGHQRDLALTIEVPPSDLEAVTPAEQWADLYDVLAERVRAHRTTLIFVNNRRLAERIALHLGQRLGEDAVASHHGSLSRERRHRLEQRLKSGDLRALVATASLELGIDVGAIDLVCQIGSPNAIATFLQRVGRSGHAVGATPDGRLFPTTRDELVECAALIRAVRAGRLDRIVQPVAPLDVLAQQIVAECASQPWPTDALFEAVRHAAPYADLARDDFDEVVAMLAAGIGEGAGRAHPQLHEDRINGVLSGRRGARLAALLNGGTIPETGDYRVVADPDETFVGTVNEDFAVESIKGDIFVLGSSSWRIRRVEESTVRVEDAHGAPPTVPFWLGEAPGRSIEFSEEVGRLRRDVVAGLGDRAALLAMLEAECGLPDLAARQLIDYLRAAYEGLGVMPSDTDVVFERFFDETGGMQLVVHAPFGARINKAWGLALRKRFCVNFDFELQAAAGDDSMLLSLGPQHSFPLEDAFAFVSPANVVEAVEQSILYIPLFGTRWRWNTTRALAVPRFRGGRRVAPFLQRRRADDLLAAVFPAQVGCQENVTGPLEFPDHPLIRQTRDDCLRESMDIDGLLDVLRRIEAGTIRLHARDTVEPSPLAHEIVTGKPYTYLDNAPLEERRTRAVQLRRTLPAEARDLGALDAEAIERVREEAWPQPRDIEEVHDALLSLLVLRDEDVPGWHAWLEALDAAGRAARFEARGETYWCAAELLKPVALILPHASLPTIEVPERARVVIAEREDARARLLRGHCEVLGPVTAAELSARTGLDAQDATWGLQMLEAGGYVLRGHFTPGLDAPQGGAAEEWCDRRLLARIHRYTLDRLQRAIEAVSARDYMRFLLRWHHASPASQLRGRAGLRHAIVRLQGFEAPASAWEPELLAARVADYTPAWLDELCLAGEASWARLTPRRASGSGAAMAASRSTPITVAARSDLGALLDATRALGEARQGEPGAGAAAEIFEALRARGALFFDEIVTATRRLATDVEQGLRELVAAGLVASDGFQGLRQLCGLWRRSGRRRTRGLGYLRAGGGPPGRWALVEAPSAHGEPPEVETLAESVAQVLLARYGVVFRDVVARESFSVPWREVLRALRRMELRGTVQGGRFIAGFLGEQYALPEAVEALRRIRQEPHSQERVCVSAVDPLNLVGIVLPGPRVPAVPGHHVEYLDGALASADAFEAMEVRS